MTNLRVAVAHDYLTQRGGAERVALLAARASTNARLYTLAYQPKSTFAGFEGLPLETSFLQRFTGSRDIRSLAPLLPLAVSSMSIKAADADVAIVSTSGWAHGMKSEVPRLVYCHTPPRWIYEPSDYALGMSRLRRTAVALARFALRGTDQRWALASSTQYVANSRVTAKRIYDAYGITAAVLPPPPGIGPDGPVTPIPGLDPGFVLTIGRNRGYKHIDFIAEAVARYTNLPLVVAGGAQAKADHGHRVRHLGVVSDAELRWLYSNCRVLAAFAHEDFGLTPIEAASFGKPTAALAAGGYLETVSPEVGVLVERLEVAEMGQAISWAAVQDWDASALKAHAATFSSSSFQSRLLGMASALAR